jgi:hypothetical protein
MIDFRLRYKYRGNLVLCKTKYLGRVNTFYSSLDNYLHYKGLVKLKNLKKNYFLGINRNLQVFQDDD